MQQQQFEPEATHVNADVARSLPQTERNDLPPAIPASSEALHQTLQPEIRAHQADVEELLRTIEQETRKSKRATRIVLGCYVGLSLLLLLAAVISWSKSGRFPTEMLTNIASFAGLSGIAFGASAQRKKATREIAQFEDIRAIGPLIDALHFQDSEVLAAVVPALTRQLPRLQASDEGLLTAEQRFSLGHYLNRVVKRNPPPVELYRAMLLALQQVGNAKSLEEVEKVAKGGGMAVVYPELRAQAEETLPFLRERLARERASQTLLRASAPEASSPATLLRAAAPTMPQEDPQQLLRADPSCTSNQ